MQQFGFQLQSRRGQLVQKDPPVRPQGVEERFVGDQQFLDMQLALCHQLVAHFDLLVPVLHLEP